MRMAMTAAKMKEAIKTDTKEMIIFWLKVRVFTTKKAAPQALFSKYELLLLL
jgi:hypothetical protein